jgi:serine/threonine protein phosphatase PrpC
VLANKQKMKNQAKELIELAKMNLSKDNLSLIIVEVE